MGNVPGKGAAARGPDPGYGSAAAAALQSDTVNVTKIIRSLYVEGAGAVKFRGLDDVDDTWNVPANFIIPVAMKRLWSTGTTATGLHAIY